MEQETIVQKLNSLIQLDLDATHAYEQAIKNIAEEEEAIRTRLTELRSDHHRHIAELTNVVRDHNGTPPELTPDFKGFLIEGFTTIGSAIGLKGALKAMRTNEKLTNKMYAQAVSWELPSDAMSVVSRDREDERQHLEYIESELAVVRVSRGKSRARWYYSIGGASAAILLLILRRRSKRM